MFSKKGDEWETPLSLYRRLDDIYHFTGDACCTTENKKHDNHHTKEQDAITRDWFTVTFCNPPYSNIRGFVKKAYDESLSGKIIIVLIPARTDTRYFHEYCMKASELIFITGRLQFDNRTLPSWKADGTHKRSSAPFPSIVVVFDEKRRNKRGFVVVSEMGWK